MGHRIAKGPRKVRLFFLFFLGVIPLLLFGRDGSPGRMDVYELEFPIYRENLKLLHVGEGLYPAEKAHGFSPSKADIREGQARIAKRLKTLKGGKISVKEALQIYEAAGKGGFHAVHGAIGEGDIDAKTSHELGLARQKFHEEVLGEMAWRLRHETEGVGVNDFGSGIDPKKISAKSDIDFTLYAKNRKINPQKLVDTYEKIFTELARKRYGVEVSPRQMDIVAHRCDAMIPDWRVATDTAEFVLRLRSGTKLLGNNPEAYFLEGAYLQQVMRRSLEEGRKTFTWLIPEKGGKKAIRKIRLNASAVPQFFYKPELRAGHAFGGSVGNYHFYLAHAGDRVAQAKYILRSLDNGPGIFVENKRGDYIDIGSVRDVTENVPDPEGKAARRRIVEAIYDSKNIRFSRQMRASIFAVYETARRIRIAKAHRLLLPDERLYADLVALQKKMSLVELSDTQALEFAKKMYASSADFIMGSNVVISAGARMREWLTPRKLNLKVPYMDEKGRRTYVKADRKDLERLQLAAFMEIHDAIKSLKENERTTYLEWLKKKNPAFRKDVELIERIIETERKMMLAEKFRTVRPETAMQMREKSARMAYENWNRLFGPHRDWRDALRRIPAEAWETAGALDGYMQARMSEALVSYAGRSYGPMFEVMLQNAKGFDSERIQRMTFHMQAATGIVNVLQAYAEKGKVDSDVVKVAVREGLAFFPLIGTTLDFYDNLYLKLRNADGSAVELAKIGIESPVGQILFIQFIPGYGQVVVALNLATSSVRLAGTLLFRPLIEERVQLAYYGHIVTKSSSGVSGVSNTASTPLLYPILRSEKDIRNDAVRSKAVLNYFYPKILAIFKKRYPDADDVREFPEFFAKVEREFLPKYIYKYVDNWWHGKGVFEHAAFSRLLEMGLEMSEGETIRAQLRRMLLSDYFRGKAAYLEEENAWMTRMKKLYAESARFHLGYEKLCAQNRRKIAEAHLKTARIALGEMQKSAPRAAPSIEILSSPKIVLAKDAKGKETLVSRKLNLRVKVTTSESERHPAPYRIGMKIQAGMAVKNLREGQSFSLALDAKRLPKFATAFVTVYDGRGKPFIEHRFKIPIEHRETKSPYTGGDSITEVLDRLETFAEKAESESRKSVLAYRKVHQIFKANGKEMKKFVDRSRKIDEYFNKIAALLDKIDRKLASLKEKERSTRIRLSKLKRQRAELTKLSEEICQKADKMRHARQSIPVNQLRAIYSRLVSLEKDGRREGDLYNSEMEKISITEKGIFALFKEAVTALSQQKMPDRSQIITNMMKADENGSVALEHLNTIGDILKDARVAHRRGKEILKSYTPSSKRKNLQQKMNMLVKRVLKALEKAKQSKIDYNKRIMSIYKKMEKLIMELKIKSRDLNIEIKETRRSVDLLIETLKSRPVDSSSFVHAMGHAKADAEICMEVAESAERNIHANRCDEMTLALNDAMRRNDRSAYGNILNEYRGCPQYNAALDAYHQMAENRDRCRELAQQLNSAYNNSDIDRFADLFFHFSNCPGYEDAQRLMDDLLNRQERCLGIMRQLNQAALHNDLRRYAGLLDTYRGCEGFDDALRLYNSMRCNAILADLDRAERSRNLQEYQRILSYARDCPFYTSALHRYEELRQSRDLQNFTNFMGTILDGIGRQQRSNERSRHSGGQNIPPRPSTEPLPHEPWGGGIRSPQQVVSPGRTPHSSTSTGGGSSGGSGPCFCEIKICPVCRDELGESGMGLLCVPAGEECSRCIERHRNKINDCKKGGVSVNR